MIINLPYKVNQSVNEMYYQRKNGKYLRKEALLLRARIIEDVRVLHIKDLEDKKLTVGIIFTENWYYKNGEVKQADLDNRLKFLIDSVFRGLSLDDKMVWEIYAKKEQSELAECVEICIDELQYI